MGLGLEGMTKEEISLSREATGELGFRVVVFTDGDWVCQPLSRTKKVGFGSTAKQAIEDCRKRNEGV